MNINERETQLYRHWNSNGELLYVGISLHSVARLCQHKNASTWYPLVASITIENFPDRVSALIAERDAIVNEKPLHNIKHNKPTIEDVEVLCDENASNLYEIERKSLTLKTVFFKPLYSTKEAAEQLAMSEGQIRKLIEANMLGAVPHPASREGYRKYLVTGWQIIDFIESLVE